MTTDVSLRDYFEMRFNQVDQTLKSIRESVTLLATKSEFEALEQRLDQDIEEVKSESPNWKKNLKAYSPLSLR